MDFIAKYEGRYKRIEEIQPSFDMDDMFRPTEYERAIAYFVGQIKNEAYREFRERAAMKLTANACTDYWHWIDDILYEVEKELKEGLPI